MEYISTYKRTREILSKFNLSAKKNLGQNFLVDQHVINKIISGSEVNKEDLVIEIGPGIGGLTEHLAISAGKVISVEIDKTLIPVLEENLKDYPNIEFINADILKTDIKALIEKERFKSAKIVANLPYYITTPIIMGLLEARVPVNSITVMIQKEVAMRMAANPGTKDYGALTLAVNYYSDPYILANVPVNCFIPRPNVNSAVIRLNVLKKPPVSVVDERYMFGLIKSAFQMRRKTLVNCLFAGNDNRFTKPELEEMLIKSGFQPDVRGESLSLSDFAKIADALYKNRKE
ncbi:MAG: 16S rRNA (adenine(1518)-N(6)/adenine(1519)-N(6))-dimethyltransferase RsmA [Clostridiales bacterium]|jgi:16S rRNA (adenine1518-N6/adenine1519-N6)-dimethyltransferase|nr:16S rRNA (adenine(1518)-N(6)/adenine(1519)-N(6))-dimethyltransferase RsmA [Clostridiales bacterium]